MKPFPRQCRNLRRIKQKKYMHFTDGELTKGKIEEAKFKLLRHQRMGENTHLTIFQVAYLMDLVTGKNPEEQERKAPIFFSLN